MKRLNKNQKGITGVGFFIVLVLVGLLTIMGLRLLPIYIEHFNVVSVLESLTKHTEKLSAEKIKPRLLRNFDLNDVENVGRQHITIKRLGKNKRRVTIDYEVRKTLMGNVDIVVHFSNSIELMN